MSGTDVEFLNALLRLLDSYVIMDKSDLRIIIYGAQNEKFKIHESP